MSKICFLSGLEIPPGKYSKEHYVPISRAPRFITSNPANIFPAHRIINHIKQNFLPCEWEDKKWNLTYHALHDWNLKQADKYFVARTGTLGVSDESNKSGIIVEPDTQLKLCIKY